MLVRGVVVCSLLGAGILHAVPHLCFLVDHDQEQWLLRTIYAKPPQALAPLPRRVPQT